MSGAAPIELDERTLILAPTGSDAANAASVLTGFGLKGAICNSLDELCQEAARGVGVILIAEEAFRETGAKPLMAFLSLQPAWSDIPIVLIAYADIKRTPQKFLEFRETGNISILERPFRPDTLRSALQVGLRARRRQYQLRDLLMEQQRMNDQLQASHATLESQVAARTSELRNTISELEAFSYSVSHDLRAPLRAMQGYSQYLLEDYGEKLDGEAPLFLRRILESSLKLDGSIQDILTYSRVSQSDLALTKVDVQKLIVDVVRSYPEFNPPRTEVEIAAPLQPAMGHEGSLTQCVSNLLGNAVKFVPDGRKPRIRIWSKQSDGKVRLSFQDNGIGIHPNNQERIFRIFEKADAGSSYEGTGIGLAIVKKAVQRMGGNVGVESSPGNGACFWIELAEAK